MTKMGIERKRNFIINFTYLVIIMALAYILIKYALPLMAPFVAAFIFAWALQKPINYMAAKRPFKKKVCAGLMVLMFFLGIGAFTSLVGIEIVSGVQKLIQAMPSLYAGKLEPLMLEIFDKVEQLPLWNDTQIQNLLEDIEVEIMASASNLVKSLSMTAVAAISSFASAIPGLFIKLVLMIISTFFIAMDYEKLVGFCLRQLGEKSRALFEEVEGYVVGTLFVCIRSYALIMSITFVELSVGLTLIGLENGILIAACISIFDILPVLGTGGIMIPWAVINLVLGNYSLAVSLLIVYIVVTVIRNILEPKIVGGQLGLHPVVTLSSMFAGVQLLGVIGLFGFPIFLSLMKHLNDTGAVKIFK